jgi:hypothetical protein
MPYDAPFEDVFGREWSLQTTPGRYLSSSKLSLAYDLHEPKDASSSAPIIFMHGLFGSKKNNRSISK